jgi:biotin operon repressor
LDALSATPQTKKELASKLGIPTRDVEALVQQYRLDGAAIVSSSAKGSAGYRLARSAAEVNECLERLRQRAAQQFRTVQALRLTRDRMRADEARPLVVDLPVPVVARKARAAEWPAWT